mmetsp:Transcript_16270/g.56773  ORF Transcript_16270/g.56773 Transcript_16270/m.56773 type:complete len:741 (-) Transcript_16270:187-2409(-)
MSQDNERINLILSLFRQYHPFLNKATDEIEKSQLHNILSKVSADAFSERVFYDLCAEALPGTPLEDSTPIPLDSFLTGLFASSTAKALPQLPRQLSRTVSEVDEGGDVFRVRNVAGDLLLALTAKQARGLTVEAFRQQVKTAAGKEDCEIHLLVGSESVQDGSMLDSFAPENSDDVVEIMMLARPLPQLDPDLPKEQQLDVLSRMIACSHPPSQLDGVRELRQILSRERDPPIAQVLDAGFLPLVLPLGSSGNAALQFEVLWALTNIASGTTEQTRALADAGAIPVFVDALTSQSADVRDQAVWALGNVAGDSVEFRDIVLAAGALQSVVASIPPDLSQMSLTNLRNSCWTLSNFCRGAPQPAVEVLLPALSTLARVLAETNDDQALTDVCWALSYVSNGAWPHIQAVLDTGVLPRLTGLLGSPDPGVRTPALRTVGNLATGDEAQTQAVLDCGFLAVAPTLLADAKNSIRKEACWTMSNITAGSHAQIQRCIDEGVINILVSKARHVTEPPDILKEVAWALSNMVDGGSRDQVKFLAANEGLTACMQLGRSVNDQGKRVALSAFKGILQVEDDATNTEGSDPQMRLAEFQAFLHHMEGGLVDDDEGRQMVERCWELLQLIEQASQSEPAHTFAKSEPQEEHPDDYKVTLTLMAGRSVGFSHNDPLLVARPLAGTLLQEWNDSHPEVAAVDGDVLHAVGEIRGSAAVLKEALRTPSAAVERPASCREVVLTLRKTRAEML